MNDLGTPPGYAEYPRDEKYRPMDTIQKLTLIGTGYTQLRWWLYSLFFVLFITGNDKGWNKATALTWVDAAVVSAIGVYMSYVLWLGTSKIFRAKSWPRGYALALSLIPGITFVLSRETNVARYPLHALSLLSLMGIALTAGIVASREFRKVGLKLQFGITEREVKAMLAEARIPEREAQPIDVG